MKKMYYIAGHHTKRQRAGRSMGPCLSRAYSGLKFLEGELIPVPGTVLIRPKESHHD